MVQLQRVIDKYLGGIIIFFLSLFNFLNKSSKPKKILLIKLWAIGDSVVSLSLVKAINIKFNTKVDVLIRKRVRDVYEIHDGIGKIIDLDNKNSLFWILKNIRRYDVVFDCEPYLNLSAILSFFLGTKRIGFRNQYRSKIYTDTVLFNKKQHMVQNYLDMIRLFGIKYNTQNLEKLEVDKKIKNKVDIYFKSIGFKKSDLIIGITPGVAESAKSRMWYEERFAKLIDKLKTSLKAKIIFIDSKNNEDIKLKIINHMKTKQDIDGPDFGLKGAFYAISKCNIFISNDTGPMHIAAAQRCKTIGLFGPNTPVLWGPYGKNNISIYKTKLKPSIQNDKGIFPDKNRSGYMGPISVDDVYNAVKKLKK